MSDVAVRLISAGSGLVSLSVLADSAIEHYRGSFANPAMAAPLIASATSLGLHAAPSGALSTVRAVTRTSAVASGAAGVGFHGFNILKRVGRLDFQNLFYGAPIGAPAALILSGLLGAAADRLASPGRETGVDVADGRAVAVVAAAGLLGTVGEASLLHFRGAYHNPAMWLPVALPPVAALALARDALDTSPRAATFALLGATAALGMVGVGFHAWGVSRHMGGWRNWRQNLLEGPPLPAPPAFTGLAVAALGALLLMRRARA